MATDRDPVICPECGGTGELGDDTYDERYKITKYRVASGCLETM